MDALMNEFEKIKIPKLQNAFFGCSLLTATRLICLVSLVVFGVLFWAYSDLIAFRPPKKIRPPSNESYPDFDIFTNDDISLEDVESIHFLEHTVLYQLLFAITLLIGLIRKRPGLLLSWVLLQLCIVSHIFVIIFLSIFSIVHYPTYTFFLITEHVTVIGCTLYCALVVYNYMLEIQNPACN